MLVKNGLFIFLRFEKSKFESLAEALELPETMIFGRGYRTNRYKLGLFNIQINKLT